MTISSKRLEGEVAVVTGGSRGIGRATAFRLAREGARVALTYRTHAEDAEEAVAQIRAAGGDALAVASDARDPAAGQALVARVLDHFGRLDVLVNNAGTLVMGGASAMTAAQVNEAVAINVLAALHTAAAAIPAMKAAGRGAIVNVAATSAFGTTAAGVVPHAVAKSGLLLWSKQLALELGPSGIRVNVVAPGAIDTEVSLPGGALYEALREVRRKQVAVTALGRAGTAEEVAACIAFLVSADAGFVTGQALSIDGGRMDFLSHSG